MWPGRHLATLFRTMLYTSRSQKSHTRESLLSLIWMNFRRSSRAPMDQKWTRHGNHMHLWASVRYCLVIAVHQLTRRTFCQDTFMSKTARLYSDTRTANAAGGSGLDRLNDDLQDVTRIMTKNMEELLWRGDSLDRALPNQCFASILIVPPAHA